MQGHRAYVRSRPAAGVPFMFPPLECAYSGPNVLNESGRSRLPRGREIPSPVCCGRAGAGAGAAAAGAAETFRRRRRGGAGRAPFISRSSRRHRLSLLREYRRVARRTAGLRKSVRTPPLRRRRIHPSYREEKSDRTSEERHRSDAHQSGQRRHQNVPT